MGSIRIGTCGDRMIALNVPEAKVAIWTTILSALFLIMCIGFVILAKHANALSDPSVPMAFYISYGGIAISGGITVLGLAGLASKIEIRKIKHEVLEYSDHEKNL